MPERGHGKEKRESELPVKEDIRRALQKEEGGRVRGREQEEEEVSGHAQAKHL